MLTRACLSLALLMGVPAWCQVYTNGADADTTNDTRMLTPPPVSGQAYPAAPAGEQRSNYLRYGLSFSSAYSDNAFGGTNPQSDVSYSIAPTIALDETTSTLHSVLSYSPGFTFYQRGSSFNAADQNLAIAIQDRLSPHVTLSVQDGLQKSSSVFNQPEFGSAGTVSGGTEGSGLSVIPPISDLLTNSAYVGVSYQFAANGMVGASGTFTNLHYPNSAEVPGLSDSSSQGGSLFHSLRISRMHYVGVSYQYQRMVSSPTEGRSETQTHTVFFFYTLYPASGISISFFGGPQYSDTLQPPILGLQLPSSRAWTPAAGASFSWQGRLTGLAMSYQHVISGGGGLAEAVHVNSGNVSIRQQIARSVSASVSGVYAQNDMVGAALFGGDNNGHTLSGTVSLSKQFGEHLSFQFGYTRLHQDYGTVPVLASTPDTNREFVSVSYQFSRPLGR